MHISFKMEIKQAAEELKEIEIPPILFLHCIVNIMRFDKNSLRGRILPVRGDQFERMEMPHIFISVFVDLFGGFVCRFLHGFRDGKASGQFVSGRGRSASFFDAQSDVLRICADEIRQMVRSGAFRGE